MDNIVNHLVELGKSLLGIIMLIGEALWVTGKGMLLAINDGVMTVAVENMLLAGGIYTALAGLGIYFLIRTGLAKKCLEAGAEIPVCGPACAACLRLGGKTITKVRDTNKAVSAWFGKLFN